MKLAFFLGAAIVAGLARASGPAPEAPSALDVPIGGWHDASGEERKFLQPVSYPASSVSTDGGTAGSAIRGRIRQAGKGPARLVVNGTAMPLSLGPDGTFARPWSFGPGSNSVEVRAAGGGEAIRCQSYEVAADRIPARLRVVLAWDTDATDLDLHVVSPSGEHGFYGDRVTESGGALDVDVTTGYGPEIFGHPAPASGTWLVFVSYYGAGELEDAVTICDVTVVTEEGSGDEKRETFRVPLRRPGDLTEVARFALP